MAAPIYTDFNILKENDVDLKELVSLAMKLGFERVAINNVITDLKTGKKQKDKVPIAAPSEIKLSKADLDSLLVSGRKCEQFSRLTAVLEDAANTHRLSTPEVQAYDILAVQPTDEKTFMLACKSLEVDIITFDLTQPLGFGLKRPLLKLAAERGIHFEINYSRALQDSSVKRQILANAMVLVEFTKGKNIILSSGATQKIDVRSPYDVMNLSSILGLDHLQAKNAVTRNARAVVLHAASRKSCKSVISASMVTSLSSRDKWIADAHKKLMNVSGSAGFEEEEEEDEDDGEDEESCSAEEEDDDDLLVEPDRKKLKV